MVLYTVLLDVDNSDQVLMAEMTTQVFFVANHARNVLTAPVAALHRNAPDSGQTVQVVARNGAIEQRQIRTGISDRLRVQILDGLDEGDHLLIGPAVGHGG